MHTHTASLSIPLPLHVTLHWFLPESCFYLFGRQSEKHTVQLLFHATFQFHFLCTAIFLIMFFLLSFISTSQTENVSINSYVNESNLNLISQQSGITCFSSSLTNTRLPVLTRKHTMITYYRCELLIFYTKHPIIRSDNQLQAISSEDTSGLHCMRTMWLIRNAACNFQTRLIQNYDHLIWGSILFFPPEQPHSQFPASTLIP